MQLTGVGQIQGNSEVLTAGVFTVPQIGRDNRHVIR